MDQIIGKVINNISKFNLLYISYLIFMNILVAGNVVELYIFLTTIPILSYFLNYQVLIVLRQILITFTIVTLYSLISDFSNICYGKERDITNDLNILDNQFDNGLLLSTLIYIIFIILIITDIISISMFVRFLGVAASILILFLYRYAFINFKKYYENLLKDVNE